MAGDAFAMRFYGESCVVTGKILREQLPRDVGGFLATHRRIPGGFDHDVGVCPLDHIQVRYRSRRDDGVVVEDVNVGVWYVSGVRGRVGEVDDRLKSQSIWRSVEHPERFDLGCDVSE